VSREEARITLAWCAVVAAAGVIASVLLAGCGASAVQSHARAATIVGLTLTETRATLLDARAADLDAVEHSTEGLGAEARLAAVEARAERWRPALVAWEATRAGLAAWVEAIALAHAAGGDADMLAPVLALAGRVLGLWGPLAAVLQLLGVEGVPELPGVLAGLVGSE